MRKLCTCTYILQSHGATYMVEMLLNQGLWTLTKNVITPYTYMLDTFRLAASISPAFRCLHPSPPCPPLSSFVNLACRHLKSRLPKHLACRSSPWFSPACIRSYVLYLLASFIISLLCVCLSVCLLDLLASFSLLCVCLCVLTFYFFVFYFSNSLSVSVCGVAGSEGRAGPRLWPDHAALHLPLVPGAGQPLPRRAASAPSSWTHSHAHFP